MLSGNAKDLNAAIVLSLGYGTSVSPVCEQSKVVEKFGEKRGMELFWEARNIIDDVNAIDINWSAESLQSSGHAVSAYLNKHYPALEQLTHKALIWQFTYNWR